MSTLTDVLHKLLLQGVELSIEDGKLIVQAREGSLSPETVATLRRHKEEILRLLPEHCFEAPLSAEQEGLWFIQQSAPESAAYNVAVALRVESEDEHGAALRRALQRLVNRHAVLRTRYAAVDGGPRQIVHAYRGVELVEIDAAHMSQEELESTAAAAHQRPFDLEAEGAFRAYLFRRAPRASVLLLSFHHIAVDGWSLMMMVDELIRIYAADGKANPLPPVQRTYQQFVSWQRELLAARREELRRAWLDELEGAPLVLNLPTDRARPPVQTFRGAITRRALPQALTSGIRRLAQGQSTTPSTVLLAAYLVLLHRYTGQEDLCVGSAVNRRDRRELAGTFGYMVNQMVLRAQIPADGPADFLSLLQQVRRRVLTAMSLQDYPFPWLVKDLLAERDPSRAPVAQVGFVYQQVQVWNDAMLKAMAGASIDAGGARFSLFPLHQETSELDLLLEGIEGQGELELSFRYNADLFDAATIDRMAGHLVTLLEGILADPGRPVAELPLLIDAERDRLIGAWAREPGPPPREACIHQLFEAQVDRAPEAIAVVDHCRRAADGRGAALTYQELDRRANQVAHHLLRHGVGPETLVGLHLERSADLIVGLLGILKAGGAAVVLDPEHPRRRLAFLLEDTGAPVLLTRASLRSGLPEARARVIDIERGFEGEPSHRPASGVGPGHLAYLLYTSGTTGQPNGALIEHRGLVSSTEAHIRIMETGPGARFAHVLSFNFDAAIAHLFSIVCAGGALHLAPRDTDFLTHGFVELMEREAITHTVVVPSMLAALPDAALPALHTLVVGGERCTAELVERWGRRRRMINAYGPTEVSILATAARCVPDGNAPPIGRPIPNIQAYVLDRAGQLVPPGAVGELCLGGVGVARGYLNRPELTARKFIDNPFGEGRLYRTGDLVRHRVIDDAPPALEFIGRADNQVKIRGYRVELSEVESALRASPRVRDAVVTVQQAGEGASSSLVAYVTPARLGRSEALERERIASWDELNAQIMDDVPEPDLTLDIKGWKSSYTGEDIPPEEMRAWAESTVARILDLDPREVLEIGCGTGMLLARVAPRVRRYRGTDLSRHAIDHVARLKAKLGGLDHVHVSQQPAHDFTGLAGDRFDTVVLSSVIQYFPSVDYLMEVIEGLLGLVPEEGAIFIGDVRNLALLEAYHASVERFRARGALRRRELRARVQRALAGEDELCVHPHFFTALRARFPRIVDVEIAPKRGGYKNELSAFRYDVTLRIGAAPAAPAAIEWRDVGAEGLTLDGLRAWIAASAPGRALGLRNIPNARLRDDAAFVRWLSVDDEDGRRPWQPPPQDPRAWEPEALYALPAELPCQVSLSWAAGRSDGSLDAIVTTGAPAPAPRSPLDLPATPPSWADLANDPLQGMAHRELVAELRRELRETLPQHLVPSVIVALPALPLTLNGKVDLRALPPPSAGAADLELAAPRSDVERKLAEVWCRVLGLDRVGIHDNFFELGGHSLLAMTMMAQVEAKLGRRIQISELFQAPTIEALARKISGPVVDSLLTPIQTAGARPPILWFTAAGVHLAHLYELGQRIGSDQPLYGIQPLDLEAERPDVTRMEVLAAHVADAIQRLQPAGPYTLTGHSAGALLALPVAFELEARGHQTTLASIDMGAPHPGRSIPEGRRLLAYLHAWKRHLGSRLDLDVQELERLSEEDAWRAAADGLQRVHFLPPGSGVEVLKQMVRPSRIEQVMINYLPTSKYQGRLVILRAADAREDGTRVSLEGWDELCARPVTTFTVPGNHVTLVLEPHVGAIVERLRLLVDEGQAHARAPFPVQWDDPEEAQALWVLDGGHNHQQMCPLDFDLRMRSQVEGNNRANTFYGLLSRSRAKLIHGFAYQAAFNENVSVAEAASAMPGVEAAVRRVYTELGSRWEGTWLPEIKEHLAELSAFDLRAADLPALLAHLAGLAGRLERLWDIHFQVLSPVILALSDFEEAYRDLFPDARPSDAYELLAGLPNKTLEGNLRLWEIGRAAAREPSLRALLAERSPSELPAALAETPEGRALWSEIIDYLSVHGERNDSLYIDAPTWIEDPAPALLGLREASSRPDRDLAGELRRKAARRESRLAEVRARFASHPGPVVDEFEALLKAAQVATVLSEDHHFWLDCKISYHARRVCLEVGRRLMERGVIEAPGDVFLLMLAELAALGEDPEASSARVRSLIAERRAEAARFAGAKPPPTLGAAPQLIPGSSAVLKAGFKFNGSMMAPPREGGDLSGMAGSSGRVTGPARIVRMLDDAARLRPGDVLVAPATLPSWTPFFATVAAVVTDHGGVLCHAAVVAREYGIPAVVGTRRATDALADGQLVEVDGDAGVVRVVRPALPP